MKRTTWALALVVMAGMVAAQPKPGAPATDTPAAKKPSEGAQILEYIRQARPRLLKGPDIVYTIQPGGSIFPSVIIAAATMKLDEAERPATLLGDLNGFVGIGTETIGEFVPITVTVSCDEVMEPSTFKGFLEKPNTTYVVMPKIKWKYGELLKRRQPSPVNVVFKVKIGVLEEVEHVETCMVRSINDCPLVFTAGDAVIDTRWTMAGYVNEDHPWVQAILKEALDTRVVTAFTGYQEGTDESVMQQAYAVWRVLRARGIHYSDIARVSAAQPDAVLSQHVRFLDECIENKQANCVDGTVMFASVLRKIGLNPHIVCMPTHAYLAVDADAAGTRTFAIETTAIGQTAKGEFEGAAKLKETLAKQPGFDEASWSNFSAALKTGTERLIEDRPKLLHEVEASPEYCVISVSAARDAGVRPIPYVPVPADGPPKPPAATEEPPKRVLRPVR